MATTKTKSITRAIIKTKQKPVTIKQPPRPPPLPLRKKVKIKLKIQLIKVEKFDIITKSFKAKSIIITKSIPSINFHTLKANNIFSQAKKLTTIIAITITNNFPLLFILLLLH